jgi:hypothetical protein
MEKEKKNRGTNPKSKTKKQNKKHESKKDDDRKGKTKEEKTPKNSSNILPSTVLETVNQTMVRVKKGSELESLAREHVPGPIKPVEKWYNPSSKHPVTHLQRESLTYSVYRDCASMLERQIPGNKVMNIWDVYGKNRVSFHNSTADVSINTYCTAPRGTVQGDLARNLFMTDLPPVEPDAGLLVDIYATEGKEPLPAQFVADVCLMTKLHTVYIIMHHFRDDAGSYVPTAVHDNGEHQFRVSSVEHVWKRTNKGITMFSESRPASGVRQAAYPTQPMDVDWLQQRTCPVAKGELHISPILSCGTYILHKVVWAEHISHVIEVCPEQEKNIVYVEKGTFYTPAARQIRNVIRSVGRILGSNQESLMSEDEVPLQDFGGGCFYDKSITALCMEEIGLRNISGIVTNSCYRNACTIMRADSEYTAVEARFPGYIASIAMNSLLKCLIQHQPMSFVDSMDEFRKTNREYEEAKTRIHKSGAYVAGNKTNAFRWILLITLCTLLLTFKVETIGKYTAATGLVDPVSHADMTWYWKTMNLWTVTAVEELVAFLDPLMGYLMGVTEFYVALCNGASPKDRIPALLFHTGAALISFTVPGGRLLRIPMHFAFNYLALRYEENQTHYQREQKTKAREMAEEDFTNWVIQWSQGKREQVAQGIYYFKDTIVKFRAFQPEIKIPEHLTHYISTWKTTIAGKVKRWPHFLQDIKQWAEDKCTCYHCGLCGDCSSAREVEFSYPLLVTSGFLWQPANGPASLAMAILRRGYADPTEGKFATSEEERKHIKAVTKELESIRGWMCSLPLSPEDQLDHEECAKAMGSAKGRNYMESLRSLEQGNAQFRKKLQEKWNEFLKGFKPRMITAFSTDVQNVTMQMARELTRIVKEHFNGENISTIAGKQVRFCVAKADPDSLNRYGMLVNDTTPLILISCDDTLALANGTQWAPFFGKDNEADFSMFDQSEIESFWIEFQVWAKEWGYSEHWARFTFHCMMQAWKSVKKFPEHIKMNGKFHVHMGTGFSLTSIGGSLFNVSDWAKAIKDGLSIEECSKRLGLNIKTNTSISFEDGATFLRGWWVTAKNGTDKIWMNLPSLSLKIGKVFKDPAIIARKIKTSISKENLVFKAVLSSLKGMPEDYPILGSMIKLSKRLVGQDTTLDPLMNDPYIKEGHAHKAYGRGECDRKDVLRLMQIRYGLSEEDICEAEDLIDNVHDLPCFVSHPVFERMRDVDYE